MQTILGASGQIGHELAVELHRNHTQELRVVSRRPAKINDSDQAVSADLLDAGQTKHAVEGSAIVYLTAGLPMDTQLWVDNWPTMMRNAIDACAAHDAKLVYFDNTYMYPQTAVPQTEDAPFKPNGEKGRVRADIARMLLEAMAEGRVQGLVCRAPEFYGPGKTQSITNTAIIEPLLTGNKARVLLRDDCLRTLIYTPDASRAMALLGNTSDAFGSTWHLPCDDNRFTYRQFIELAADTFGVEASYRVVPGWQPKLAGLFNAQLRDAAELLPRYDVDNIFVSDKFKQRFPDFSVTTHRQGLTQIFEAVR